ncbi:unnamed protein product [Gordionus sp. m RMFG-2023]
MEQEEYLKEGIAWEKVDFFDNRPILDLIEENKKGIIYVLDEECVMPGERTDMTFLHSLESRQGANQFFATYTSCTDAALKKTLNKDTFLIKHYAGHVKYSVDNFLEKNKDSIVKDLKIFMNSNENIILKNFYTQEEIDEAKRPPSAGMQFKSSLSRLVAVLMQEELYYIRCLKPNEDKKAGYFNEINVEHQVMYLGLMENIRVCRSGYAYRKQYELFLKRYYPLSKTSWPTYSGDVKENVLNILKSVSNFEETKHYGVGKTKIFIRNAKDVMLIEQCYQKRRSLLVADIQAVFKAHRQKKIYHKIRGAIIVVQKHIRRYLAKKKRRRLKWANLVIKGFVIGYRHYKKAITSPESAKFFKFQRYAFLSRIAKSCPINVLHKKWPTIPAIFNKSLAILKNACYRNLVKKYMNSIKPGDPKDLYLQKLTMEKLAREKEIQEKEEAERIRREKLGLPPERKSRKSRKSLFGEDIVMPVDEDEFEECEVWEEGEEYFVDQYGNEIHIPPEIESQSLTIPNVTKKKRRKKIKGGTNIPGKLAWQYVLQAMISTYEGIEFDEDKLMIEDEELKQWVQKRCREIKAKGNKYINKIKDLLDIAMLSEEERNPPITIQTFQHIFTMEFKQKALSDNTDKYDDPNQYHELKDNINYNRRISEYSVRINKDHDPRTGIINNPSINIQAYPILLSEFHFKPNKEIVYIDVMNNYHYNLLTKQKMYKGLELDLISRSLILLLTQYPYANRRYIKWRNELEYHQLDKHNTENSHHNKFNEESKLGSLYFLEKKKNEYDEIDENSNDSILHKPQSQKSPFTIVGLKESNSTNVGRYCEGYSSEETIALSLTKSMSIVSQENIHSNERLYLNFGDNESLIPLKYFKESFNGYLLALDTDSKSRENILRKSISRSKSFACNLNEISTINSSHEHETIWPPKQNSDLSSYMSMTDTSSSRISNNTQISQNSFDFKDQVSFQDLNINKNYTRCSSNFENVNKQNFKDCSYQKYNDFTQKDYITSDDSQNLSASKGISRKANITSNTISTNESYKNGEKDEWDFITKTITSRRKYIKKSTTSESFY